MRFTIDPALKRYPVHKKDTLQAWDAADELLLEHLNEHPPEGKLIVLNDSFGALSIGLEELKPEIYTDSFVATRAIALNSAGRLHPIHELGALSGPYQIAIIRVPKNMSFFEDQLCHLSRCLRPGAKVICGYMVKHQAKASFDLLNRIVGETSTSLAKKKARLIFADFSRLPTPSPYPREVRIEGFIHPFVNHSNLFSREGLDVGTRFLLEHLPHGDFPIILDLGCANGIVGIAAKRKNPRSKILFSDESAMAVKSAKANWARYFPEPSEFFWNNCHEGQPAASVDLVLCNPPFHQGTTLGDAVARQMFRDSFLALRPGGKIRVIGNSHLRYQVTLRQIFGNSEVIATNRKFMIVDAIKP